MLVYKVSDLLDVCSAKTFSYAEFFSRQHWIAAVVEGQLPHDVVSEFDIKDVVVFSSLKHLVSLVVLRLLNDAHVSTAAFRIWIDHFSNVLPLVFSRFPHKCLRDAILLEDLNIAFLLALQGCLLAHIRCVFELLHVGVGCLSFKLSLELLKFLALVGSSRVSGECSDLVVFRSYDQVAKAVLSQTPNCSRKQNGLLATTILTPNLSSAVISS